MHWLEEFRLNYTRKDGGTGISRKELARMVRKPGSFSNPASEIGCSEALIDVLVGGGITRPAIADRIADVTGATAAQRDMLVHKIHQGTYAQRKRKHTAEERPKLKPTDPGFKPVTARPVVRIDIFGQTIRYGSIQEAAMAEGCNKDTVKARCNHSLSARTNEFATRDHTWRYADEWDEMGVDARMKALSDAGLHR